MSRPTANTPEAVVEWLRARPNEPFWFSWIGDRLVIGIQSDDGMLDAFDCRIVAHKGTFLPKRRRRRARSGEGKGR